MPYLINPETRLTLKATEAGLPGTDEDYVIWDPASNAPVVVTYPFNEGVAAPLFGTFEVNGMQCPTGGQLLKESCEEWTLEKGAEICWLDAGQIERALEIYTDPNGQSGIMQGVCIDQYVQSQQCALGALNLEFLMGNVEKPGTMLQKFAPAPCKDQLGNTPRLLSKEKVMKRCGTIEHKGILCWDMAHIPSVFKAMKDGDPYQIHMWIERSGNKHVVLGNSSCLDEIVPKLDYVVQCFMYPTAFSVLCADLLLPTTEWLETNLTIPQLNTIVMRQAVTHLFETVEEGIIWTQIVQKCAELGNEHCPKAFDEAACMTTPFYKNEYEKQKQHLNKLEMSWEEACEQGVIQWATPEEYRTYQTYLAEDPENPGKPKGFGTPSKKLEVYCESNIILVAVRRGEAARAASGERRLRTFVLLRGAGRVAPDRYRVPARAHRGAPAHVPPRHPAQHSLPARDLPCARDVDPSRRCREVRHRRWPVGQHREPTRQDPWHGPRDHGHRQGRGVSGALLGSRTFGFRRSGPGLQGDEHQCAH
jgi:anaerobic selenocysteine-containing dehydrogenase